MKAVKAAVSGAMAWALFLVVIPPVDMVVLGKRVWSWARHQIWYRLAEFRRILTDYDEEKQRQQRGD